MVDSTDVTSQKTVIFTLTTVSSSKLITNFLLTLWMKRRKALLRLFVVCLQEKQLAISWMVRV
jgi:hypothetical protein